VFFSLRRFLSLGLRSLNQKSCDLVVDERMRFLIDMLHKYNLPSLGSIGTLPFTAGMPRLDPWGEGFCRLCNELVCRRRTYMRTCTPPAD
jgi:hypothetical protein